MSPLNTAKIIRRVRQRLGLSQEGLSRLLNATKGAVQHWERGRNNPDLARLLALRELCPPGTERRELDAFVRQARAQASPVPVGPALAGARTGARGGRGGGLAAARESQELGSLRRENARLERLVEKLKGTLERRNEQLRILEDVAAELQREAAKLRAAQPSKAETPPSAPLA